MIHEAAPSLADTSSTVKGGSASPVSSVAVQSSLAALAAQVDQLCRQRDELTDTLARLRAELQGEREKIGQLHKQAADQKQIIAFLWDKAYPLEKIVEDLKNYPPPEQCHSLEDLVTEMREFSQTMKEQHTS
jgi:predicted nuclease with TOPRIM domain